MIIKFENRLCEEQFLCFPTSPINAIAFIGAQTPVTRMGLTQGSPFPPYPPIARSLATQTILWSIFCGVREQPDDHLEMDSVKGNFCPSHPVLL